MAAKTQNKVQSNKYRKTAEGTGWNGSFLAIKMDEESG
jgi:hypothetical protein